MIDYLTITHQILTSICRGVSGSALSPEWLNAVLQSLHMTTMVNGVQNLTLISNLALSEISMNLPGEAGDSTDSGLVTMSSFVVADYQTPFPSININVCHSSPL